jgi:hypothetical protein
MIPKMERNEAQVDPKRQLKALKKGSELNLIKLYYQKELNGF